jgi:hypothetical protein
MSDPAGPAQLDVTARRDAWWAGPALTALGLLAFGVYATFRAIQNDHYLVDWPGFGELLSPFYSPLIVLPWLPAWISPAFLILWAPGGFRMTCYYYRKAYYRSLFADPFACAVGEPRGHSYQGERRLFLFQNLHRYFLYLALAFLVVLALDTVRSCIGPDGFQVTVGTLVLAANTALLTIFTFSCHALRHLVGGKFDCFSCPTRYRLWKGVSRLNEHHMFWAWTSLFMVGFADFYVWMVASGAFVDARIF